MLMCTRGITGDKALEIQQCWKTPRAFFEALENCGGKKERETMLETRVGGKLGRKKIGKVVCGKVAEIWGETRNIVGIKHRIEMMAIIHQK